MRRPIIALGLVWVIGAVPGSASAYLLPARHILRKVNARLAKVGTLQVALVGRVQGDPAIAPVSIGERWVFSAASRSARVDVNAGGGRKASWSRSKAVTGEPSLLPTHAERLVFTRLFADRDAGLLMKDLSIDSDRQRLDRMGDRIAHVIGSNASDDRSSSIRPEIWIDQDDFTVMRVRFQAQGSGLVDLRFGEWSGPPVNGFFPHQIRVMIGNHWVRVVETDQVRANVKASTRERRR